MADPGFQKGVGGRAYILYTNLKLMSSGPSFTFKKNKCSAKMIRHAPYALDPPLDNNIMK